MAFRRFNSSRRPAANFRSRSRFMKNRTREPRRTGHWQRANFDTIQTAVVDTGSPRGNVVVIMAQIKDHVSDSSVGTGRAIGEQVKFLEVGGLVFDWQMNLGDLTTDDDTGLWVLQQQIILCSDRLDAAGTPAAVNVDWTNTQTPISLASAQQAADEEQEYPTRVHWRHSRNLTGGYYPSNVTGTRYPSTHVVSLQGSANLRLRLRLDDEHVLAFHLPLFLANSGGGVLTAAAVTTYIVGSMYYRTRWQ